MIHSDEDDEFDRIARENKIKSSGMECCTYDCIQGRDCPIRKARANPPQFPTMLRKMWSGSEVQDWINENWNKG